MKLQNPSAPWKGLNRHHIRQNRQDFRKGDKAEAKDLEKIHAYLLSAIAHDLRTPLSGIMGNSLLYLENHETLSKEEKLQLMSHIHEDSGWLLNIAGNLLAITRIRDEGKISTRDEIAEEVLSEALEKLERRHPRCAVRVAMPEDIIMLPMDALLIEQVILNLLENALLHSGSTEPIDILVENGATEVSFTVRDYGCGIPEEMLGSLFDSPSRMKVPADCAKKAGIGLAVCKAIISAHHGTLKGRNHGRGAEFIFTLPKRSC